MPNPRRRALARASTPRCRTDDRVVADPARRALLRRLVARADEKPTSRPDPGAGIRLREGVQLRRLRTIRPGDPAPLLIRLIRRPFALRAARTVRSPGREPLPALERPRTPPSSQLSGSLVTALRASRDLRDPARPLPGRERPVPRRTQAPEPVRFDPDPEGVAP